MRTVVLSVDLTGVRAVGKKVAPLGQYLVVKTGLTTVVPMVA